ncbi:MAG TPA: hypothetical protein VKA84_17225 [Gemmatimonadaceae bacterium]|nr:hypothetical protein [Gemmatimonadaceae bacterium]
MPRKSARKTNARPPEQAVTDLPAAPMSPATEAELKGGTTRLYIGETEKNLNLVFDTAKQTDAALLFGEGDQLLK